MSDNSDVLCDICHEGICETGDNICIACYLEIVTYPYNPAIEG